MPIRKWFVVPMATLLVAQLSCAASTTYPQEVSLKEARTILGTALPVPTYLPQGHAINQVYVTSKDTVLLIIGVAGAQPSAETSAPPPGEIRMRIQWWNDFVPGGLKIPGERVSVGGTSGVFWDQGDHYSLLWQPLDTTRQGQFDLALTASKNVSKDEILKIANSVTQLPPSGQVGC